MPMSIAPNNTPGLVPLESIKRPTGMPAAYMPTFAHVPFFRLQPSSATNFPVRETHNQITLRWRELHSCSKLWSPARVCILLPTISDEKGKLSRGGGWIWNLTNVCSTSQGYHCCGNDRYEPLSSCSCVCHSRRKEVARNGVWMETIVTALGLDWICASEDCGGVFYLLGK